MSTPFAREIAVDEYNPKSDITYSDGTGVNGGDYGRSDRKGGKFMFKFHDNFRIKFHDIFKVEFIFSRTKKNVKNNDRKHHLYTAQCTHFDFNAEIYFRTWKGKRW